ncbi:MAG: hypothetical protein A4E53_04618 [Pelotomaculum sp. PtaB.Bin104]|nr:MAG: hypothetical protein A4E53_04618 [Pelotomaculum sp. PtaB.Bin104]
MKYIKISLIIVILVFVLSIPTWFIYTRFCLPVYKMEGELIFYKNDKYVMQNHSSISDEENLGNTVGIGVGKERTLTDLIWPYWVIEYKNDKEHERLFLRGLMGSGGPYTKVSK